MIRAWWLVDRNLPTRTRDYRRAGVQAKARPYNGCMHLDDTIVAIATAAGRGGIGVVRISGPEAKAIASGLLRLPAGRELEAGRALFGEFIDSDTGERIDEVVATHFAKPHSYT